jgi:hypothetical protein
LLGHLRVLDENGAEVQLSAPKLRTLLALLLVNRDRPVSADLIADTLWGDEPPPSAPNLVHGYVRDLRQRLGAQVVVTVPGDTGSTSRVGRSTRSASRTWYGRDVTARRWRFGTEPPSSSGSNGPGRGSSPYGWRRQDFPRWSPAWPKTPKRA